jgi:hypothetical protein
MHCGAPYAGLAVALLAGRLPSWKKGATVQAAILAAVRDHVGKGIERVGEDAPARWSLMP